MNNVLKCNALFHGDRFILTNNQYSITNLSNT